MEKPLYKVEMTDDLLARASRPGGGLAAKALDLPVETKILQGSSLHLAGKLKRVNRQGTGSDTSVEFSATLDGRIIFRKNFAPGREGNFNEHVDLQHFDPGNKKLVFQIRPKMATHADARWKIIRLERRQAIARKDENAGPNILVILVDTFRADHAGLYGYDRNTTPELDAFSKDALVFDHALSPAAWTLPSVASMMTGQPSCRMAAVDGVGLPQKDKTIAELMLDDGITTAAFSANPLIGPSHGFDQGFETFEYFPWERASEVNTKFLKWLNRAGGLQWFAYLHYIDPHDPYEPPPKFQIFRNPNYRGIFRKKNALNQMVKRVNYGKASPFEVHDSDIQYLRNCYDEEIHYWDHCFGQLMQRLRQKKLFDDTIVVVLADHGEAFGDHGKFKHGQQVYEEAVHVPLLIRFPGKAHVGRKMEAVETRWLGGTLLKTLKLKRPRFLRGSLLKEKPDDDAITIYTRYTIRPDDAKTRRGLYAQWKNNWKYIRDLGRERDELYDLPKDPFEKQNLDEKDPGALKGMRQGLADYISKHPGRRHQDEVPSEETIRQLRALGYVQ